MATESGEYTQDTISRRRIAEQLFADVLKPRQIYSPLQGMGQLGEAAIAGITSGLEDRKEREGARAQAEAIAALLGGGVATPPVAPSPVAEATTTPDPSRSPTTLVGDNPPTPPAPAPVRMASMSPEAGIVAPPRAVVPSSAKVIGDEEGVRLGLYDPPKAPGMAPPSPAPSFGDRFAAANGATPPASPVNNVAAALNPAAGLLPAAAPPPAPVQVAQNAPAGLPAAPDNKAAIAKMLQDPNPYVRKMGIQLGQAAVAKQLGQQPKYHKLNDEMLFEEGTGATKPAGPGFKALVDPTERAAHGIPTEDKRPYQLGPGNKLINPPAETRINIDQSTEKAFDTGAAKHQVERLDAIVKDGASAKQMMGDLNALRDIGSRITTGKAAEVTAALGPYAEALGLKIDGLSDLQAFEAITSKLAPQMRVPGTGATSDFEMRTFMKAIPSLGKTPEGNELVSKTFEAIQTQKQAAAEIASKVLNKEIPRSEGDKMLRELPDPMTMWKEQKGKLPTATNRIKDGWEDIGAGVRIREKR